PAEEEADPERERAPDDGGGREVDPERRSGRRGKALQPGGRRADGGAASPDLDAAGDDRAGREGDDQGLDAEAEGDQPGGAADDDGADDEHEDDPDGAPAAPVELDRDRRPCADPGGDRDVEPADEDRQRLTDGG